MSQTLVELFQQTIHNDFHLDRQDRIWLLKETPPITIKSPSRHSLGFSLDCNSSPFNSFLGSNPPSGIAKMCDGIIVVSHKDRAYIFVIEQKTGHKDDYKKQLANGKHFCDWILALLKEHDYYDREVYGEVDFIFLLCWQPREKSPRKGETRHGNGIPSKKSGSGRRFFEVKNKTNIHLLEFIK